MSKAERLRQKKAAARDVGTPGKLVFPGFPYERKFTRAEIRDILERARRCGDAMRDGMGPNGAILGLPGDIFELWMIHAALAGVDVDESKAYIRARNLPDETGRMVDARQWVLIKEDTPEARAADTEREAEAHLKLMEERLRPEVITAIRRRLHDTAEVVQEELDDEDPDRRVDPTFSQPPKLVRRRHPRRER